MSILVKYANEIAEEMNRKLEDKEFTKFFKTASLEKTSGQVLENFKKDIDVAAQNGTDLEQVYSKHVGALAQEDNKEPGTVNEARKYMESKSKLPGQRQPGMAFPEADDCCCGDGTVSSPQEITAVEFTLNKLISIANALDSRGFNKLATIIDDTIKEISTLK